MFLFVFSFFFGGGGEKNWVCTVNSDPFLLEVHPLNKATLLGIGLSIHMAPEWKRWWRRLGPFSHPKAGKTSQNQDVLEGPTSIELEPGSQPVGWWLAPPKVSLPHTQLDTTPNKLGLINI